MQFILRKKYREVTQRHVKKKPIEKSKSEDSEVVVRMKMQIINLSNLLQAF